MNLTPYELMQKAVDIVQQSEHPANKVAAAIAGTTTGGTAFAFARTNYWPEPIKRKIGVVTRIGDSSGTIHAETACLLEAPITGGAALYVTDVPCPNCVKNMAEAGIKTLYIDHKGFAKDFALRRGGHFNNMALRICEKAGINIYRLFRKEKRLEEILKISEHFNPVIENPPRIIPLDHPPEPRELEKIIAGEKNFYQNRPFALAIGHDAGDNSFMLSAESHPCPGYTAQTVERGDEKYSTILQPVNRIMMNAARLGLKITPKSLYSSQIPTSRELVDMVGTGLVDILVENQSKSRDINGLDAMDKLKNAQIVNIYSKFS